MASSLPDPDQMTISQLKAELQERDCHESFCEKGEMIQVLKELRAGTPFLKQKSQHEEEVAAHALQLQKQGLLESDREKLLRKEREKDEAKAKELGISLEAYHEKQKAEVEERAKEASIRDEAEAHKLGISIQELHEKQQRGEAV